MFALFLVSAGCNSSPNSTAESDVAESSEKSADVADNKPAKTKKKSTKKKGEALGGIPKDVWPEVWLENPSLVAAEKGVGTKPSPSAGTGNSDSATPPKEMSPSDTGKPSGDTNPSASGGTKSADGEWAKLISGEALTDEAKAIRASLTAKLQTVGQFNGAYRDIQVDAAVLASLAQIASEIPDAPNWKKNAPLVRDLSGEVVREASSVGEKFYKPTREAFDKLDSLLSGSVPPGLGDSPAKMSFQSFAPRYPLMKRFERAQTYLKSNINSESLLKKENDMVIREAGIVAVLAQVILVGGYDDAEDEQYQALVGGVREGAVKAMAAAREQDYPAYTASLDLMYKSCTKCHSEFKNN